MTTPLLLLTLLAMASTTMAHDGGHYTVQLRLSALSSSPVTTTVALSEESQQSATVTSAHTADLTFTYTMSASQVLNNEPVVFDVSTVTDKNFHSEPVSIDRDSSNVHTVGGGLIKIVSSRSQCAKNYYGPFCSLWCAPIEAMHLTCTSEGVQKCADGWQGPNCNERACPTACKHGHCDGSVCKCRAGFTGLACDRCIPSAGCLSGVCRNNTPNTCACQDGWVGPLCNIDLSLCSASRSPCASGSQCIVKAPGKTECVCPEGKTGAHCEIETAKRPCPCKNGGSCLSPTGRFSAPKCLCPAGFTGPNCEQRVAVSPVPSNGLNPNLILVLNVVLVLFVLAVAVFLFDRALRYRTSRPCGGPCGPSLQSDEEEKKTQQPKTSSVSLLMPDGLDSAPSSPSKGDHLFTAAKEHSKKVVVFDSIEEPRYSACPKKSSVFSITDPTPTVEKTYETLPV